MSILSILVTTDILVNTTRNLSIFPIRRVNKVSANDGNTKLLKGSYIVKLCYTLQGTELREHYKRKSAICRNVFSKWKKLLKTH